MPGFRTKCLSACYILVSGNLCHVIVFEHARASEGLACFSRPIFVPLTTVVVWSVSVSYKYESRKLPHACMGPNVGQLHSACMVEKS
jgi:hypothetical protein